MQNKNDINSNQPATRRRNKDELLAIIRNEEPGTIYKSNIKVLQKIQKLQSSERQWVVNSVHMGNKEDSVFLFFCLTVRYDFRDHKRARVRQLES